LFVTESTPTGFSLTDETTDFAVKTAPTNSLGITAALTEPNRCGQVQPTPSRHHQK
jgi:hypothetical protein